MPLDVPAGQTVFVDSTILHYAFVEFPGATPQCIEFLRRVAHRDLVGCVTAPVVNDAVHKVMCSEAVHRFNQTRAGLVNWLKSHPDRVRELTQADQALRLVEALPVALLGIDFQLLIDAQGMARDHGLLASDALIVATMRRNHVAHLVTNDDDFDRVPGMTIWKPR
jgi:predicted nucleic acid-binding protein